LKEELGKGAHSPPNYLSLRREVHDERGSKIVGKQVITLLVGVEQQTLLQYANDTTILVIRDEENLWNMYPLVD